MLELTYLVRREQQNISARRVHFVTLSGMDSFLLNSLYLQRFKFLIKHLAKIHDDTLVNYGVSLIFGCIEV